MDRPSTTQGLITAFLVLALLWRVVGSGIRRYFVQKMTVMKDIPNLGLPRPDEKRINGTAVICGGSVAGLWAARICADHFEKVLVIEPEEWTASEESGEALYDENGVQREGSHGHMRKRVFQYNAVHGFQPMALRALRRIFPDFDAEVKNADGRILVGNVKFFTHGGLVVRAPIRQYASNLKDIENFFMSRDAYERVLRGLVRKSSKRIGWLTATATGLRFKPGDSSRVQSVLIRTSEGVEKEIPAALVIDCSGPTQAGLKWLKRLYATESLIPRRGSVPFESLRIEYKTSQSGVRHRIFVPKEVRARLPIPGGYDNAGFIYVFLPRPGVERCFFMLTRIEGHRIEMYFGGWNNPPTPNTVKDINGYFKDFEAKEAVPSWLLETVDMLIESQGAVETEREPIPGMSWVRYDKAPYHPSNFIAIDDSVMCLNPTFGQGCSKAAVGAITLDGLLRSHKYQDALNLPGDFAHTFFKTQNDRIEGIWDGSKPMDYQWESTTPVKGEKRSDADFQGAYSSALIKLAINDDSIDSTFWHVQCFLAPPTDVMHPTIVVKVLLLWLKQWMEARRSSKQIDI